MVRNRLRPADDIADTFGVMAPRLPKIAARAVQRPRIQAWLEFHCATAVRYVSAPPGSGKTTCAVLYARGRAGRVAFATLPPMTDESALIDAVAQSIAVQVASYAELLARLQTFERIEIIIDDVDNATIAARALLNRLYRDVSDNITFVYLARSEEALGLRIAQAQGIAEICDPALFAFDLDDVARYAASLNLQEDLAATARLCEVTHGWSIAVAGACRTAAAHGLQLPEALRYWCRRMNQTFREIIGDVLMNAPTSVGIAFGEVLSGCRAADQELLAVLRRHGLFVTERGGRLALNPLLRRDVAVASFDTTIVPLPRAQIEMFGRFEMSMGGQEIFWRRRRDRQMIAFLAMQPDGRASRSDLIEIFWPEADPQLARQSLRTACSTIRSAIAAVVGASNVAHYFVAERIVALNLENVSVSAHRFHNQFDLAQTAFARDDIGVALTHYGIAQALYRSPFLIGEPPTAWAVPYMDCYSAMYDVIVARLYTISLTGGTSVATSRIGVAIEV